MKHILLFGFLAFTAFGEEPTFVPSSETTLTTQKVLLVGGHFSNVTDGPVTVTIRDRSNACGGSSCEIWTAIQIAAHSAHEVDFGRLPVNGLTWLASAGNSVVGALMTFPSTQVTSSIIVPPPSTGFVQGCTGTVTGFGVATMPCTFGQTLTAGDSLYCLTIGNNAGGTAFTNFTGDSGTFTADPGGGTAITNLVTATSDSVMVSAAFVGTLGGGGSTITANFSPGINYGASMSCAEFHGFGTLDNSENGQANSSTSATSGAITPSHNGDYLLGVCVYDAGVSGTVWSAGTSVAWSLQSSTNALNAFGGSNSTGVLETFTQPAAASVYADCDGSANYWYWAHIVALH